MSKIQINTNFLWDIGKNIEQIQNDAYRIASELKKCTSNLTAFEDFLQLSDEQIESVTRKIQKQADRCGLAANYLFKVAEKYEFTENDICKRLSSLSCAVNSVRSENNEIYKKYCTLSDDEKMQKAIDMEFSYQWSTEAKNIPYPGGDGGKNSTAYSSACGAYAWLHILRYYGIDNGLTIQEICNIAVTSGARPWSGGTDHQKMDDALKNEGYDVSCSGRSTNSDEAIEHLKNGQPIISSFPNNVLNNTTSTSGHFVAIVDISEDGNYVLVIDSTKRKDNRFDGKYNGDTEAGDGRYWMPIDKFQKANSYYMVDIGN